MIDYFFGKPRTGKSYRAVKYIFEEYIKKGAKPKYPNILTNIGGFKHDILNEHFQIDYDDKIDKASDYEKKKIKLCKSSKLVWSDFHKHLIAMWKMSVEDEADDEALNRYANYHKINDCLIVLDEASFYMKKYNDAISWWLAYHGHFKMRIIIITQGPKQIYSEYMTHTEIFWESQPQSKQLKSNSIRYISYDDYYFSKDSKFGSETIKTSPEIFALYKSGETDKPKKMLYKFIFLMLFALIVMFGFYKLLMYRLSPPVDEEEIKDKVVNYDDNFQKEENSKFDNEVKYNIDKNSELIVFRCDERYCWLAAQTHKYEYYQITLKYFKHLILKFSLDLDYMIVKNEIYSEKTTKHSYLKTSIVNLVDYHYFVPKDVKKIYLSRLFIPVVEDKKQSISKSLSVQNPFINSKSEADYE